MPSWPSAEAGLRPKTGAPVDVIEPVTRLALALHSNPGAYALLAGSGLSDAAGVPTGWDGTRRCCRRDGERPGGDLGADS